MKTQREIEEDEKVQLPDLNSETTFSQINEDMANVDFEDLPRQTITSDVHFYEKPQEERKTGETATSVSEDVVLKILAVKRGERLVRDLLRQDQETNAIVKKAIDQSRDALHRDLWTNVVFVLASLNREQVDEAKKAQKILAQRLVDE